MKVGEIIASILETIVKLAVFLFLCSLIYKGALMAYDYGYRVFTEPPVSVGEGRIISVEIKDGQSAKDIGEMLQQKGLVRDGRIFYIQELLSEYRGQEVPGIYDLSTAMTSQEMLAVMCPATEGAEDGESDEISIISEQSEEELGIDENFSDDTLSEDMFFDEEIPDDESDMNGEVSE